MTRHSVICASLGLLAFLTSGWDRTLYGEAKPAETISLCEIVSRIDKYRDTPVTLRVRVNLYRHGTTISDQDCPKQSLLLIADQAAVQTDALSHFYQFLAEHKRSTKPIFATIAGRLVKGEDGGYMLKRDVVFKLESVSEVSEGG